jgi:hypothetical protein
MGKSVYRRFFQELVPKLTKFWNKLDLEVYPPVLGGDLAICHKKGRPAAVSLQAA